MLKKNCKHCWSVFLKGRIFDIETFSGTFFNLPALMFIKSSALSFCHSNAKAFVSNRTEISHHQREYQDFDNVPCKVLDAYFFFSKAPIRLVNKWTTKLLSDSKPSSHTRSSTNRQFFSTRSIPILPTIEYSTHIDAFYKAREETEGLVIGLVGWMQDFIISWPVESVYLLSEHLTKKNA